MRAKIRRVLDTSKPINLRLLSPIDKIKAGFITQWQTTDFYKRNKLKKEDAEYQALVQKDDNLKNFILALLYKELSQNHLLSEKGKICDSMIISIDQRYEDSLQRLFPDIFLGSGEPNKDFLSYEISKVPENADIRKAFKEMPILLKCAKKHL